jgi:hypothetical protein
MENTQERKKKELKKVNNNLLFKKKTDEKIEQHSEKYFLVKSVYMDVLIKKRSALDNNDDISI